MKRLLNTLFVTTQGAYLAKDGETVLVRIEKEDRLRVPIHTLGGIVCFGQVNCSPWLMNLCAERGVFISFLSEHGRFLARVQGPVSGNVLLRREHYRRADDPESSAGIARSIVTGKILNSRTVLMRGARDHPDAPGASALEAASVSLARIVTSLDTSVPLDVVRGREGEAASIYFGSFDALIVAQKDAFIFRERSRRPPLDPVNALLSFVYTLLVHDAAAACEGVGLDPAVGFLHRDRPGRPGLALDLMEELRAFLADRLVLSLINRQQVAPRGFTTTESGAVIMDDSTRKEVLVAWQKRKQDEILHPFINEKVAIGLLPHVQALLLARHLRGDLDAYPPFIWK
ncbi:MAG: type I-C CRISPR-associated endonuclease Cas1c [Candidatus Sumerlaeota bacterium]|nr:type I-C CRISPR-associated endonuclease Cas1c [Candidatus Sumerlaeota bacterium]